MAEGCDVLVVDDEPVVRDAARLVLVGAGLSVAAVADGRSALAHPAAASCRLVLCDLMLPDGSGLDVIRALREIRPSVPIVLITGYPTPGTEDDVREAGAAACLLKPFTEAELLSVVRAALRPEEPAPRRSRP